MFKLRSEGIAQSYKISGKVHCQELEIKKPYLEVVHVCLKLGFIFSPPVKKQVDLQNQC